MAESRPVNPLVEQFRAGSVPRDLRLIAAQGALPLKPADLVDLLEFLLGDREPEIAAAAAATLGQLPAEELLPIVKDRGTSSAVLAWAVASRSEKELREAALQNTSLEDAAIEALVGELPAELAELVVINQTRLLRSTSLLVALEGNPNLNNDQKRRLRELRESFHIGEEAEAPAPPVVVAPPPPEPEPEPEVVEEAPPERVEDAVARYLSEEEREEPEKLSAVQRVYKLNTSQKIVLALKGNREERAVLVRDPNRLVCLGVLGSPRITEAEIEAFAGMKNISDVVIRAIAKNRDWIKNYPVMLNLVKNPRTPLALSIGMVSRLAARDMKALSIDRNVSEVLRKQAKKFIVAKEQPGAARH